MGVLFHFGKVEPPQDALCKWLEEAVSKKPNNWGSDGKSEDATMHSVQQFENVVLGVIDMGTKLVVRKCFLEMRKLAMEWMEKKLNDHQLTGVFVITGTPGIGKSVFLAYFAAYLCEKGYHIVIQRGQKWWSYVSGKASAHGKEEPKALLDQQTTVLLFDPFDSEAANLQPRSQGVSFVFTSPGEKCYKTAFKQQSSHSTRRFMPIWTLAELIEHRLVLLPSFSDDADVKKTHALLGRSVRWLRDLVAQRQKKPTQSLEDAARELIRRCLERITAWDDLDKLVRRLVPSAAADTTDSKASLLLQIDAHGDFETPSEQFLASGVAKQEVCKALNIETQEARAKFVKKFLEGKPLGQLVGEIFEVMVLNTLTGKGQPRYKLSCKPLAGGADLPQQVPNAQTQVPLASASKQKIRNMNADQLSCPHSDNFAATDFFFVTSNEDKSLTLWLSQTTKDSQHDCKIKKMREDMAGSFSEDAIKQIPDIRWVVVAPAPIAASYKAPPKQIGLWNDASPNIEVKQYVHSWVLE